MEVSLLHLGLLTWGGCELSSKPPSPQLDISGLSHPSEDIPSEQRWIQRLGCQCKQGKDAFMVIHEPGHSSQLGHSWINVGREVQETGMLLRAIQER